MFASYGQGNGPDGLEAEDPLAGLDLGEIEPNTSTGTEAELRAVMADLDAILAAPIPCKVSTEENHANEARAPYSQDDQPQAEEACVVSTSLPPLPTLSASSSASPQASSEPSGDPLDTTWLDTLIEAQPVQKITSASAAPTTVPASVHSRSLASRITPPQRSAPVPAKPLPAWRHMTDPQQFTQAARTAQAHDGLPFTANLSPELEAQARATADPAKLLSDRLNRQLRKHGLAGVPFAFVLETAPGLGKLHLHGVLIPGEASPKLLRQIIATACGRITDQGAAPRQVSWGKDKAITGADGWASYCLGDRGRTRRALCGQRVVIMNTPIKKLAKATCRNRLGASEVNAAVQKSTTNLEFARLPAPADRV